MLDDDRSHWTGATSIPSTSDGSSVVLIWGDNDEGDDEEEDQRGRTSGGGRANSKGRI